jgi:hypothetical protein
MHNQAQNYYSRQVQVRSLEMKAFFRKAFGLAVLHVAVAAISLSVALQTQTAVIG